MVAAMGETPCCDAVADFRSCRKVLLWHTVSFLRNKSVTCALPLADTVEPINKPASLDFNRTTVKL